MSIFGFTPPKTGGGDFLPIIKYDARAGRITRVDSVQTATGWERTPVDITNTFKALIDLEGIEVGWIDFSGAVPNFVMVPFPGHVYPPQPSEGHKQGFRCQLKLAKDCAGGAPPIREFAGNAERAKAGFEALYAQYVAERDAHPGMLPAIILEGTLAVASGTGQRTSTNYQPIFKIVGWAPRGDMVPRRRSSDPAQAKAGNGANGAAPATGAQYAAPPQQPPQQQPRAAVSADDFG
jgi:hypothetical protein